FTQALILGMLLPVSLIFPMSSPSGFLAAPSVDFIFSFPVSGRTGEDKNCLPVSSSVPLWRFHTEGTPVFAVICKRPVSVCLHLSNGTLFQQTYAPCGYGNKDLRIPKISHEPSVSGEEGMKTGKDSIDLPRFFPGEGRYGRLDDYRRHRSQFQFSSRRAEAGQDQVRRRIPRLWASHTYRPKDRSGAPQLYFSV